MCAYFGEVMKNTVSSSFWICLFNCERLFSNSKSVVFLSPLTKKDA